MSNINKKSTNTKLMLSDLQNKVPFSIVEAYKNIRTNVISILSKTNSKILAITSSNASEGKSTTSVNIAITLAQLNKKVVLLDADSRRPSIHKKLKIENTVGCMDILTEQAKLDDVVVHYNDYLDIICSGVKIKNPAELYSSTEFDDLLELLKDTYDYVIIDTPPINPVSDTLIIAQKCEAIIMVVRSGVTSYESFEKAYESLKVLDVEPNGVIVNGSNSGDKHIYKRNYKYGSKYSNSNYSNYY